MPGEKFDKEKIAKTLEHYKKIQSVREKALNLLLGVEKKASEERVRKLESKLKEMIE